VTLIHTSSFRAFRPEFGLPVVTSLGLPKWLPEAQDWPRCWLITPTAQLFREPDPDAFAAGYRARLERFGVPRIARTLERIAADHDAGTLVLLCHEADWEQCHRLSFATWWMSTGELVTEIS
jgi:hypothetical protein